MKKIPFVKRFEQWLPIKKSLDQSSQNIPGFKERDLWMTSFGENVGFESSGKNDFFHRPVIVLLKFNKRLFFGIPTSTKNKPKNPFYIEFTHKGKIRSAMISQMRVMDGKRLDYRMGRLSIHDFQLIKSSFLDLFIKK